MEEKCLRQLDRPGSWEYLKADKPDESEPISWRHVRRIFGFNLGVFLVVFAVLTGLVGVTSGADAAEIREDLPVAATFILAISCLMALYVANLYRRTWNRRAHSLRL